MNIPIYRAKKIDGDEWVEGSLYIPEDNIVYIIPKRTGSIGNYGELIIEGDEFYEVSQNTLAIHFPNMIDKNGKKIFASLSEDGVGGDDVIYKLYEGKKVISVARYRENQFHYCQNTVEVIGIHKGENNE